MYILYGRANTNKIVDSCSVKTLNNIKLWIMLAMVYNSFLALLKVQHIASNKFLA